MIGVSTLNLSQFIYVINSSNINIRPYVTSMPQNSFGLLQKKVVIHQTEETDDAAYSFFLCNCLKLLPDQLRARYSLMVNLTKHNLLKFYICKDFVILDKRTI